MLRPSIDHLAQDQTYVHQNLQILIQKLIFYFNILNYNGSYDLVMFQLLKKRIQLYISHQKNVTNNGNCMLYAPNENDSFFFLFKRKYLVYTCHSFVAYLHSTESTIG